MRDEQVAVAGVFADDRGRRQRAGFEVEGSQLDVAGLRGGGAQEAEREVADAQRGEGETCGQEADGEMGERQFGW
jgi:hypothetical protein